MESIPMFIQSSIKINPLSQAEEQGIGLFLPSKVSCDIIFLCVWAKIWEGQQGKQRQWLHEGLYANDPELAAQKSWQKPVSAKPKLTNKPRLG